MDRAGALTLDDLELTLIDVETTGTSPVRDRIIEVAALRVSRGETVEQLATLVDPERSISPRIARLTGITDRDVRGAPLFREIGDDLLRLLKGSILVAHNAPFDYGFLRREFERGRVAFSAPCLCTARLSRRLFPEHRRHNLDSIIERFGLSCAHRHRALDDARVLGAFLRTIRERVGEGALNDAVSGILKHPVLPPLLDESVVRALPETHGVYLFYGREGEPLYAGKAANLRARVLSHFAPGRPSARETALRRCAAEVKAIETAGELGALLRQSDLVRDLSPALNRPGPGQRAGRVPGLKPWPFPGPILIEEKDGSGSRGEVFVIDRWCLLLRFLYDECGVKRLEGGGRGFDHALYRALTSYLGRGRIAGLRQLSRAEVDLMAEADPPTLSPERSS